MGYPSVGTRFGPYELRSVIGGQRFLAEHIESGTGDMTRSQGLRQCGLVDEAAPRYVHDDRALAHAP